ncbi:MAG: hypothetical protein AAGA12_03660 [Pseudomonadota bacterium]
MPTNAPPQIAALAPVSTSWTVNCNARETLCAVEASDRGGQYTIRISVPESGTIAAAIVPTQAGGLRVSRSDQASIALPNAPAFSVIPIPPLNRREQGYFTIAEHDSPTQNGVIGGLLRQQPRSFAMSVNGTNYSFRSSGVRGAMADANARLGSPLNAGALSRGSVALSRAAQSGQATSPNTSTAASRCSRSALDAEANRRIASFGRQPAGASTSWRYAYNLTRAMITLTEQQARRCPSVDLSFALNFHRNNLGELEQTGRASGWL